ncbi:MAG: DUF1580 domain-containing protein [Rhodopirellula sp.]|nr:DUF1580 domain-containing protein [Rhodopirellula sp.]
MPVHLGEQLLALGQAMHELPNRPSPSTAWRWYRKGIRGVRLETVVVGGRRYTSREALDRFLSAVTSAADSEPIRRRERDADVGRSDNTERKLRDAGLL